MFQNADAVTVPKRLSKAWLACQDSTGRGSGDMNTAKRMSTEECETCKQGDQYASVLPVTGDIEPGQSGAPNQ
jgi:hypothetical protein